MSRHTIATIVLVAGVLLVLLWLSRDRLIPGAAEPAPGTGTTPASSGSPTVSLFTSRAIGNASRGEERPQIAHVAISDLDRDGWPMREPRTSTATAISTSASPASGTTTGRPADCRTRAAGRA